MDPNMNENAALAHKIEEVVEDLNYDATRFMSSQCQARYYDDLLTKKLKLEKGITDDKVSERLPDFHGRLVSSGWTCFIPTPCDANEEWVREFYANLRRTHFQNHEITIRENTMIFGVEEINDVYGLPNHPLEPVQERDTCDNGDWLVAKLCPPGHRVTWATKKKGIKYGDFTAEAKMWLYIIASRVSPCGNVSDVPYTRALIIACILDGIPVNVGHYIVRELKEYVLQGGTLLIFPSLITELCRRAHVEKWNGDHLIPADKPLHPLRVTGAGSVLKSKKRKVEITVGEGSSSQTAQAEGPFGMLNSQLASIRDLVSQLPSGPSHSQPMPEYFNRDDMKTYLDAQKKQAES